MPFIEPVDDEDFAEPDRAALGYVPNYNRLFARRPAVYEAWKQLNGAVKSTTVKEAFGLAVQTTKGKQLTLQQATIRWIGTEISALTCGLGFLMCAFPPKKQALQDMISKTEVVWVGDK